VITVDQLLAFGLAALILIAIPGPILSAKHSGPLAERR